MSFNLILGDGNSHDVPTNDILNGTAGADWVFGLQFNDTIDGLLGDDLLIADGIGAGNDSVYGGDGDDTIFGGGGNDIHLDGGTGDDHIEGEVGNDAIDGSDGNDVLWGQQGNDTVGGGNGDDFVFGSEGADNLDGGAGNDRVHADAQDSFVSGGAGILDVLVPTEAFGGTLQIDLGAVGDQNVGAGPLVQGFEAVDASILSVPVLIKAAQAGNPSDPTLGSLMIGGTASDTIWGSDRADILRGFDGNDVIRPEGDTSAATNDTVVGGNGADTLEIALSDSGTVEWEDYDGTGGDDFRIIDDGGNPLTGDTLAQAVNTILGTRVFNAGTNTTTYVFGDKTVILPGDVTLTADDFGANPANVIESATGTPQDDGFGQPPTGLPEALGLDVDTSGGTRTLIGEAGGSVIDGLGGIDVLRITGDASMQIILNNPSSQLAQLDLNGDGVISGPAETNAATTVRVANFEVFDAYPRQTLVDPNDPSDEQLADNYFGNLAFNGTSFTGQEGDGTRTDGNIVLGGFGDDSIQTGVGNDFIATGGGTDYVNAGRNSDWVFAELSLLDPNASATPYAWGGTTVDTGDQDQDWLLGETQDDEEPVWFFSQGAFTRSLLNPALVSVENYFTETGAGMIAQEFESFDASGNMYGFTRNVNVALGGARDLSAAGAAAAAAQGEGIGSTGQHLIFDVSQIVSSGLFGSSTQYVAGSDDNIFIAGFDNDEVAGFGGDDLILGGNGTGNAGNNVDDGTDGKGGPVYQQDFGREHNPALANTTNDGRDSLFGGDGDDTIGYESWDVAVSGDDGFTITRGNSEIDHAPSVLPDEEWGEFDYDLLLIDNRTSHRSLLADGDDAGAASQKSVYGELSSGLNPAYDRGQDGHIAGRASRDIYNIDGAPVGGDGGDSGTVPDQYEYLTMDTEAWRYGVRVTGVSSVDQTGGVDMAYINDIDGGGYIDDFSRYLADLTVSLTRLDVVFDRSLLTPVFEADVDGDNDAELGGTNLSFFATSVRLDLRGEDRVIDIDYPDGDPDDDVKNCYGDFSMYVEYVEEDELGDNWLVGGYGTDRIEGRTGDDLLFGGPGTAPDLFVFDAQGDLSSESEGPSIQVAKGGVDPDAFAFFLGSDDGTYNPRIDPGYGGHSDNRFLARGDGLDVIGDFAGGQGVGRSSTTADQVLFTEYNEGNQQGYLEDRAAALYDAVQLDSNQGENGRQNQGNSNTEGALQASDFAFRTGDNSVIATRQGYSIDFDDLQRNDKITVIINGREFSAVVQTNNGQWQAVQNIAGQINALAGQDTEILDLTAYLDDLAAYGFGSGEFEADGEGGEDNLDDNDTFGSAIRLSFANLDPNYVYQFQVLVGPPNNQVDITDAEGEFGSSGDQFADGRINNQSGTYIYFADYDGGDNGFDGDTILYMLRNSPQELIGSPNPGDRGEAVQTSILATALEIGGTLTGLDAFAPGSGGVDVNNGLTGRGTTDFTAGGENASQIAAIRDQMWGAYGDDNLAGGNGNDVIVAGTGDDVVHGSVGFDNLQGGGNLGSGGNNLEAVYFTDRLIYTADTVGRIEVNIDALSSFSGSAQHFTNYGALRGVDGTVNKGMTWDANPLTYPILQSPASFESNISTYSTVEDGPDNGVDTFTGFERIDKFGNNPEKESDPLDDLGDADLLNISGLSDSDPFNLGIDLNLTNGLIDIYDLSGGFNEPPLLGTFSATGFEWVYGGAATEHVINELLGVDLNGDGDYNDIGELVSPTTFESNVYNLGSHTSGTYPSTYVTSNNDTLDHPLAGRPNPVDIFDGGDGHPDEYDGVSYSFSTVNSLRDDADLTSDYDLSQALDCDPPGDDNRPDIEIYVGAVGEGGQDDDVLDPRTQPLGQGPNLGGYADIEVNQVDIVRFTDGMINAAINGKDLVQPAEPIYAPGGQLLSDPGGLKFIDDWLVHVEIIDLRYLESSTGPSRTNQVHDDAVEGDDDYDNPLTDILNVVAQSTRGLNTSNQSELNVFDGIVINQSQYDIEIGGPLGIGLSNSDRVAAGLGDNILEPETVAYAARPGMQLLTILNISELEFILAGAGDDRVIVASTGVAREHGINIERITTDGLDGDLQITGTELASGSLAEDIRGLVTVENDASTELYFRFFLASGNDDTLDYRTVENRIDGKLSVIVDFTESSQVTFVSSEGSDGDFATSTGSGAPLDGVVREGFRDKVWFDPEIVPLPQGFILNKENGHYYGLTPVQTDWASAQQQAEALGGYLVTVTSDEEDDFIYNNFINSLQEAVWAGGSDAGSEGDWLWVTGPEAGTQFWEGGSDGSTVGGQYANWNDGEPNDASGEDYLEIGEGWNDLYPEGPRYGLIEIEPPSSTGFSNFGDRVDFAYNVEVYYGGSFSTSVDPGGEGVAFTPNTIDVREAQETLTDDYGVGGNVTNDDVYVIFSGDTQADGNNPNWIYDSALVRRFTETGNIMAEFVDPLLESDGFSNVAPTAIAFGANYWAEVQGGNADDIVMFDDAQSPLLHQLFLGQGTNTVDYTSVAQPQFMFYGFEQATTGNDNNPGGGDTNSTQSDLEIAIREVDGTYYQTDQADVIEQDDITGKGTQRELTVRGSTDSAVTDVLSLDTDVSLFSSGENDYALNKDEKGGGTHFISLGALGLYANNNGLGPSEFDSGVVISNVIEGKSIVTGDDSSDLDTDQYDTTDDDDHYLLQNGNWFGDNQDLTEPRFYNSAVKQDDFTLSAILGASGDVTGLVSSLGDGRTLNSGVQSGNTKLGVNFMEVINGHGAEEGTSLVMFGYAAARETIIGGAGNDVAYFTGDAGDVLDAFKSTALTANGSPRDSLFTDFAGYDDGASSVALIGTSTVSITSADDEDNDVLAVIDTVTVDTLADGFYVFNFNGAAGVGGNQFVGPASGSGANGTDPGPIALATDIQVFDFEHFSAREVGTPNGSDANNVFFIVQAVNLGQPNVTGSMLFGGNSWRVDNDTVNGDGGDTLISGNGNDTIEGGYAGDFIDLGTSSASSDSGAFDVVVYKRTSDSVGNPGVAQGDDGIDVIRGFSAGPSTNTSSTNGEDFFDFGDVDANTSTTVDEAFAFYNVLQVTEGSNGNDFSEALQIAASQGHRAVLIFVPDGTATTGVTDGTLYAWTEGDSTPDMVIQLVGVTGSNLENLVAGNFIL